MDKDQIIKAWKNPEYRSELKESADGLPQHPAGAVFLFDEELEQVFGGSDEMENAGTESLGTIGCCTYWRICNTVNTAGFMTFGCC